MLDPVQLIGEARTDGGVIPPSLDPAPEGARYWPADEHDRAHGKEGQRDINGLLRNGTMVEVDAVLCGGDRAPDASLAWRNAVLTVNRVQHGLPNLFAQLIPVDDGRRRTLLQNP
ncbi:MAG: hypothetical protein NVS4B3_00660 [Gemmatimonadaceae bacterium]